MHHAKFGLFKDHKSSLSSFSCWGCDVIVFDKSMELIDRSINHPLVFYYESFEGHRLDCVKVNLVENLPPNIVKDEPYAFDESYLSNWCSFVQMMLSIPSLVIVIVARSMVLAVA